MKVLPKLFIQPPKNNQFPTYAGTADTPMTQIVTELRFVLRTVLSKVLTSVNKPNRSDYDTHCLCLRLILGRRKG
jgi:hypothetical protein